MNNKSMTPQHKYSQVRATFAISKASLRSILRNPSSVIFTLLFPLIFIIVFGFIGGGSSRFDIGFYSKSDINNPLYHSIINVENFNIEDPLTDAELDSKLEKGETDALLLITKNPPGTMPEYNVEVRTNKAKPDRSNLVKLLISQVITSFNLQLKSGQQPPVVTIKQTEIEGRVFRTIDFILPGQLGFSILSAGVFGTAFVFISLKETLVIKRFFATPINRNNIVLGEAISRLIFSISGSVIIISIGHFVFGFTLINGIWTFLNMLGVSAIGLIVFLGLGFLVSNIAKNLNAVPPIANLITLPQFLLAGTFFSIDVFPAWLQPISRVLPLTYLNDALRKIAFDGATIFTLPNEMLILAAWGAVIYAVTIKFFKWE